jgi:hypothetical protein
MFVDGLGVAVADDDVQPSAKRSGLLLEAAGVEFIDENGGGPGVRLRKRK